MTAAFYLQNIKKIQLIAAIHFYSVKTNCKEAIETCITTNCSARLPLDTCLQLTQYLFHSFPVNHVKVGEPTSKVGEPVADLVPFGLCFKIPSSRLPNVAWIENEVASLVNVFFFDNFVWLPLHSDFCISVDGFDIMPTLQTLPFSFL